MKTKLFIMSLLGLNLCVNAQSFNAVTATDVSYSPNNGSVAIGPAVPAFKLDVSDDDSNQGTISGNFIYTSASTGNPATAVKGNATASNVKTSIGVEGDASGSASSTNLSSVNYGIRGLGSGGGLNYGGYFEGSGSTETTNGENVGVYGKVTSNGSSFNTAVYGNANGYNSANDWAGYFVGNVYRSGTDNFSSDKKLKKEIKPLLGVLAKIMLLKPSTYFYRTDEFKLMTLPTGQQMGLIAQDLETVFPELVKEMSEIKQPDTQGNLITSIPRFKSVQYINLIPVLIAGMQEQQKLIDEQIQRISQLTQKVTLMSEESTGLDLPGNARMEQNEPNPFTGETIIKYYLPTEVMSASLVVYDLSGKQIANFPIEKKGEDSIVISAEKLAAGIYLYSIVTDRSKVDLKRMIISEK